MFISRKKKQFIYTVLYLLPFILFFVFYFCSSKILSLNNVSSIVTIDEILYGSSFGNFLKNLFSPLYMWFENISDSFYMPISNIFNFIFTDVFYDEAFYDFLYGITFYFDYCIIVWIFSCNS